MAKINFFLQSTNNPANIYVRLTDGRTVDIKAATGLIIDAENWSDKKRQPKNLNDIDMKNLNAKLERFRSDLIEHYNSSSEQKNLAWLKAFISPALAADTDFVKYVDTYLADREDLNKRTAMKIRVVQAKMRRYCEKNGSVMLKDINEGFKKKFQRYNKDEGYSENTITAGLAVIKTICLYARRHGIEISPQIDEFKNSYKKAASIYLRPDELEKVENKKFESADLDDARDWLLISCHTGQRISDFMRFEKSMIRVQGKVSLIEFTQKKTGKIMSLPLHPKVVQILERRNGEFPPRQHDVHYNKHIKTVCRMAQIDEVVYGGKINEKTVRKEYGMFEKFKLVSSHVGRRSFATNYYGKIPTPLLMYATGHTTEKMFLTYIGKADADKAIELASWF